MKDHDHSYKNLFSHPEMVTDLLKGFVNEDWVQQLDFSTLEKLNSSYITDDLRERADDVVWRVKFKDEWLYVYLLLEFQSRPDTYMAVRLLTYIGLLYQDLIKSKQLPIEGKKGSTRKLPPVFPLVLYNGKQPWNAAQTLSELIQAIPKELQAYQPEMRYLLINERGFSDSELEPLKNIVAALFRLENSDEPEKIVSILGNLTQWLKEPEQLSLGRAFVEWLNQHGLPDELSRETSSPTLNLVECKNMLAENMKIWMEDYKEKTREQLKVEVIAEVKEQIKEQIKEQGIEQGIEQGEHKALQILLIKRFGTLPEWAESKLKEASSQQLECWIGSIFDANTLEDIFR